MNRSEFARQVGLSASAVLFYERKGLLSPRRRANGYRDYRERDAAVTRLLIIARQCGFTIAEVRRLVPALHRTPGRDAIVSLLAGKQQALAEQIAGMQARAQSLAVLHRIVESSRCLTDVLALLESPAAFTDVTQKLRARGSVS